MLIEVSDTNIIYGLIGNGRISKHLQHYFKLLGLEYILWDRSQKLRPEETLKKSTFNLVCISDDAIEGFLKKYPTLNEKPCIHFSGALTINLAQGFHPHCNFTQHLYDQDFYPRIPFVIEKGEYTFKYIFPSFENPHFEIDSQNRAKYHALCVMAGNFPTMLWSEISKNYEFLNLPKDFFFPYIENIVREYQRDPNNALTGPFVRKDINTIEKNLSSLEGSTLKKIYQAFKNTFFK